MNFLLRIAQKREEAVNREISKVFANEKNANKKDKDDRYERIYFYKLKQKQNFFFFIE